MYSKNGIKYANAGYYLLCDSIKRFSSASEDCEECLMNCENIEDKGVLFLIDGFFGVVKRGSRKEYTDAIVRSRYTLEDQVDILEKGNADDLKHLKEWKEWAEHVADLLMPAESTLESAKEAKIKEIDAYDTSNAVNEFTYNGQTMWIEFDLRKNITHDIKVLKAKNIDEFTFWFNGTPMTFPIDVLESLLVEIEIYALKCFNVTAQHKADVEALKTVEEVLNYDFTVGYPSKLNFEL